MVEMGRLRAWLVSYPYPSQETVDKFFTSSLYRDLETVTPGNAAGNSLLQTLRDVYRKDHQGTQLAARNGRAQAGQGGAR